MFLCSLAAVPIPANADAFTSETVVIEVDAEPFGTATLELGVTHTQHTLDFGAPEAIARAEKVLRGAAKYQNQHIMGWGALNPEPSPGVYDWSSLDRRINLIRRTGGVPVITLCCAPDWMKGGDQGTTNWGKITKAPLEAHFNDFAHLAKNITTRYPDIEYYQVWNELKGFWDPERDRWNYEAYTTFYNTIYDALKKVELRLKIGGPYVPMRLITTPTAGNENILQGAYGRIDNRSLEAVLYWLQHKQGADFITIDGATYTGADRRYVGSLPDNLFDRASVFSDVANWLRKHTDLPIWWAEWYSADASLSADLQNALMAESLRHMVGTADVALRWAPQGEAGVGVDGTDENLWSDTKLNEGGEPFPFGRTAQQFRQCFPRGASLHTVHTSSSMLSGLASRTCIMLINKTEKVVAVNVGEHHFEAAPYAVLFLAR